MALSNSDRLVQEVSAIAGQASFDHARAGSAFLGPGDSVTEGQFFGLLVLNDAVLNGATGRGDSIDNLSGIVGQTLPAGIYIPVALSGAAVTSGLVQLLKEPS